MAAPMFNVFVGSETGLLKGVNTVKDYWKNLNEISEPDKSNEIRSLAWTDASETNICVGLRNKRVGNFNIASQCFTDYISYEDAGPGLLKAAFNIDDGTVTAVDSGVVSFWRGEECVNQIETIKGDNNVRDKTPMSLSCIIHNHFDKDIIATGGRELDLQLWNVNDTQAPVFTAKNVKNDWLNLRVPIWVTGIGYVTEKNVVTSTGHHQVRVYDPAAQRRPVLDMTWEEYPITAMSVYTENQIIVGNTQGNMALLDIRKGQLVHNFKGFAGSIRSIECHATQPVVASCGLDRFFRLHDINTKQLLQKKYMKSRLNCVLFSKKDFSEFDKEVTVKLEGESFPSEVDNERAENADAADTDSDNSEDADEEMWEKFEVVKTRTVKRNAKEALEQTQKSEQLSESKKLKKGGKKQVKKSKGHGK